MCLCTLYEYLLHWIYYNLATIVLHLATNIVQNDASYHIFNLKKIFYVLIVQLLH